MDFKDGVALGFQQADAVRFYWNLWVAVGVGLLGLLAGIRGREAAQRMRSVALLGFLVFAGGNLAALHGTQQSRIALRDVAVSKASTQQELALTGVLSIPRRTSDYVAFHLVCDAIVCWGILRLTRRA